jgi:putative inorganic carbon (hco3(-)) transporter
MQPDVNASMMPAAPATQPGVPYGPARPAGGSRKRTHRAAGRLPWDLMMLSAAGLLLITQARLHSLIPVSLPRPAVIMVIVAVGVWLIQTDPVRSSRAIMRDRIGMAAFLVLAAAIIGVPFSLSIGGSATAILSRFSRTFAVFLILAAAVRNLEDVRRLIVTFALGAAAFGAMAPVQRGTGGSIGGYDPNDAAMFLVSALPCLVFCVLHGRRLLTRMAAGLSIFTVMGTIVMTSSRGGFIGLVAVIVFMLVMFKGVKLSIRMGVVGAIMVLLLAVSTTDYWDRMQTITELDDGYGGEGKVGGRMNIWGRALEYTAKNPLTGVGIGQFSRAEGQHPAIAERIEAGIGTKYSAAHSMWFQAMAELGIPGFLAFVAIFFLSFKQLRRLQKTALDPPSRMKTAEFQAMASTLMASLVGVMAAGSFLTHAFSGMTWGAFGIIVGLTKVSAMQGLLRTRGAQRRSGQRPTRRSRPITAWGHDAAHGVSR